MSGKLKHFTHFSQQPLPIDGSAYEFSCTLEAIVDFLQETATNDPYGTKLRGEI
jgi:hypothetical protein